jgi:hypothetical protein
VRDIAYEYIAARNRIYKPYLPKWLGIDEITLDGTIDKCCCVLVDVAQRKPIDLLPDRRLETIKKWLNSVGECDQLKGVCMDMYENFRRAVRQVFRNMPIPIVLDRFHVLQWANEAVDRIRRRVGERDPDVKKTKPWKTNVKLLRKRWGNIPRGNKAAFLHWLSQWPELQEVYIHKENFCQIYQFATKDDAEKALEEWETSLPEDLHGVFKEVFTAITKWREEFLAFIDWHETNAYTEGFNSVIRNVNNQGRGYTFQVLRGKLLFANSVECETFRIERRRSQAIKDFRKAKLVGKSSPKICMECKRSFDEEDPADVLSGQRLPPGGTWCPSCSKPFERDGDGNLKLNSWAGQRRRIPCDGCGRWYYNKMTPVDSGLRILCKKCLKREEEAGIQNPESAVRVVAYEETTPRAVDPQESYNSFKEQVYEGRAVLEGVIPATNSIPTVYLKPNYEAMYNNLERMRLADAAKNLPKTKRALGYPIIAKDLRRVLRGRPPSDPAVRSKKRNRKDEDDQSSLDLQFEELRIKFKPKVKEKKSQRTKTQPPKKLAELPLFPSEQAVPSEN